MSGKENERAEEVSFDYDYEEVYDYYIIEAWRGLETPVPAYTPEMVTRHTELVGRLPWVKPTPSADDRMVLGRTRGWQENAEFPGDPEIPAHNIFGYMITEADTVDPEIKMILAAGNHSTEFTGNWVLEGAVNFLASKRPEAKFLRRKGAFYVYPDLNPDGRYQAVHRIDLEAAPDPNAGTNMRKRGNPELYAAGEDDHNRIWNTEGKFTTSDILTSAMKNDTGQDADYLWDLHGPQTPGNWRSPCGLEAWESPYGKALITLEPDVEIAGLPGGFKSGLSFQPGKLSVWAGTEDGLNVDLPYVYEPGGWTKERLLAAGRNLGLALYDVLQK